MSNKRVWLVSIIFIRGEHQELEYLPISTDTGEEPTEKELRGIALEWYGYGDDPEDDEDMWDDKDKCWYGHDDDAIYPAQIVRELLPIEELIWDMARQLPYHTFSLDDFMTLVTAGEGT